MASQNIQSTVLGLFLLLALFEITGAMYVTKVRRLPLSSISFRQAGLLRKRALDSLDGSGFGFEKRALDMLDGSGFGMRKRALDMLDGSGFTGMRKRALDMLEGTGFGGLSKRSLDSLDGTSFGFDKRSLDLLEGTGFGFDKRGAHDRYIRISVNELNQLENIKRELREELRRRRMLNEEARLLD